MNGAPIGLVEHPPQEHPPSTPPKDPLVPSILAHRPSPPRAHKPPNSIAVGAHRCGHGTDADHHHHHHRRDEEAQQLAPPTFVPTTGGDVHSASKDARSDDVVHRRQHEAPPPPPSDAPARRNPRDVDDHTDGRPSIVASSASAVHHQVRSSSRSTAARPLLGVRERLDALQHLYAIALEATTVAASVHQRTQDAVSAATTQQSGTTTMQATGSLCSNQSKKENEPVTTTRDPSAPSQQQTATTYRATKRGSSIWDVSTVGSSSGRANSSTSIFVQAQNLPTTTTTTHSVSSDVATAASKEVVVPNVASSTTTTPTTATTPPQRHVVPASSTTSTIAHEGGMEAIARSMDSADDDQPREGGDDDDRGGTAAVEGQRRRGSGLVHTTSMARSDGWVQAATTLQDVVLPQMRELEALLGTLCRAAQHHIEDCNAATCTTIMEGGDLTASPRSKEGIPPSKTNTTSSQSSFAQRPQRGKSAELASQEWSATYTATASAGAPVVGLDHTTTPTASIASATVNVQEDTTAAIALLLSSRQVCGASLDTIGAAETTSEAASDASPTRRRLSDRSSQFNDAERSASPGSYAGNLMPLQDDYIPPLHVHRRDVVLEPTASLHYVGSASSSLSLTSSTITSAQRLPNTSKVLKSVDEFTGIKSLNQYVLMGVIGQGSCGKVKLAFSLDRNISVAIKIARRGSQQPPLPPPRETNLRSTPSAGSPNMSPFHLARNVPVVDQKETALRREIAIMKKLRHKNIVALYEVIDDPAAAKLYLVMQYVDRGCVSTVRGDGTCGRLPLGEVLSLARQVAAGLGYLHQHGVVHRDIKPENILASSEGRYYLSDFGVSDLEDVSMLSSEHLSAFAGVLSKRVGTRQFMAPEQFAMSPLVRSLASRSASITPAIDVWALGVTLLALALGRLPSFASELMVLDNCREDCMRYVEEDLNIALEVLVRDVDASSSEGCRLLHEHCAGRLVVLIRRMLRWDAIDRCRIGSVRVEAKQLQRELKNGTRGSARTDDQFPLPHEDELKTLEAVAVSPDELDSALSCLRAPSAVVNSDGGRRWHQNNESISPPMQSSLSGAYSTTSSFPLLSSQQQKQFHGTLYDVPTSAGRQHVGESLATYVSTTSGGSETGSTSPLLRVGDPQPSSSGRRFVLQPAVVDASVARHHTQEEAYEQRNVNVRCSFPEHRGPMAPDDKAEDVCNERPWQLHDTTF